jgi:hypothetical protein
MAESMPIRAKVWSIRSAGSFSSFASHATHDVRMSCSAAPTLSNAILLKANARIGTLSAADVKTQCCHAVWQGLEHLSRLLPSIWRGAWSRLDFGG